ncbi:MAG: hypothetical protein ACEPOZ_19445 [Marinifilaceae bacterium]
MKDFNNLRMVAGDAKSNGKTVAFKTLGCRLNQYETDALASQFRNRGFKLVPFDKEADVYVINSCTVTHQSDHKSRNFINQAHRRKPNSVLVVTGCMANNAKEELENRPEINYVVENDRKASVFSLLDAHFKGEILHPSQLNADLFSYQTTEKGFHTGYVQYSVSRLVYLFITLFFRLNF